MVNGMRCFRPRGTDVSVEKIYKQLLGKNLHPVFASCMYWEVAGENEGKCTWRKRRLDDFSLEPLTYEE